MGGRRVSRTGLLASGALAASALLCSAVAQEAALSASASAENQTNQVDFSDPEAPLPDGAQLDLSVRNDPAARFAPFDDAGQAGAEAQRRLEFALAAGGGDAPLDISIAQRASLGADRNGDVDRQGRGSEVRVGRGLVDERRDGARNSTYVFVASDNEALTWQPGMRSDFGGQGSSFALQGDRVEVGDLSAGVTWERDGVQTSLAYVEREQSTHVGNQSFSQDESFAGVTVTMRR